LKLDLSNTIKKDFAGIIDEIGESITLNRATKTTSNLTGDRTVSFGSDVIINAAFQINSKQYVYGKEGLLEIGDASLYSRTTDSVSRNDKIVYNSIDYIVKTVLSRFGVDQCVLFRRED